MQIGKFSYLNIAGSVASILGLLVSLYVLWKEWILQKDVTALKSEEESWHNAKEIKQCSTQNQENS